MLHYQKDTEVQEDYSTQRWFSWSLVKHIAFSSFTFDARHRLSSRSQSGPRAIGFEDLPLNIMWDLC